MAEQTKSRITRVTSPGAPEPQPGTWSNCLVVNGVAYVAGMVDRGDDGKGSTGDEYEQAKAIFAKIKSLIEAAGGAMADVVKVTIFVTDIKKSRESLEGAPRGLHRQLPRQHPGAGGGPRRPQPQGRDRGRGLHRRRCALSRVSQAVQGSSQGSSRPLPAPDRMMEGGRLFAGATSIARNREKSATGLR